MVSPGRLASLHTYPVKGCHRLDQDSATVEPWGLAGDRRWMVVDDAGVGVTQREAAALVRLRPEPRPDGLVLRAEGRPDLDVAEPVGAVPVPVRVFKSRLPVDALPAGGAADEWLANLLDRPARLVWLGQPTRRLPVDSRPVDPGDRVSFADGYPLLLTNRASLEALNGWLGDDGDEPLPMARFRSNLVVDGVEPWAEDGWIGGLLRVGSVVFRVASAKNRCVVTTTDQETGVRGQQPLRVLAKYRKVRQELLFGVDLVPITAAGDLLGTVAVGDAVVPESG